MLQFLRDILGLSTQDEPQVATDEPQHITRDQERSAYKARMWHWHKDIEQRIKDGIGTKDYYLSHGFQQDSNPVSSGRVRTDKPFWSADPKLVDRAALRLNLPRHTLNVSDILHQWELDDNLDKWQKKAEFITVQQKPESCPEGEDIKTAFLRLEKLSAETIEATAGLIEENNRLIEENNRLNKQENEQSRAKRLENQAQTILVKNKQIDDLKEQNVALQEQLENHRATNARQKDDIIQRDDIISSLREAVNEQNASWGSLPVVALHDRIFELNKRVETLKEEIKAKDVKITSLSTTLAQNKSQIAQVASLQKKLDEALAEVQSVEEARERQKCTILERNNTLSERQREIQEQNATIHFKHKAIESLQIKLDQAHKKLEEALAEARLYKVTAQKYGDADLEQAKKISALKLEVFEEKRKAAEAIRDLAAAKGTCIVTAQQKPESMARSNAHPSIYSMRGQMMHTPMHIDAKTMGRILDKFGIAEDTDKPEQVEESGTKKAGCPHCGETGIERDAHHSYYSCGYSRGYFKDTLCKWHVAYKQGAKEARLGALPIGPYTKNLVEASQESFKETVKEALEPVSRHRQTPKMMPGQSCPCCGEEQITSNPHTQYACGYSQGWSFDGVGTVCKWEGHGKSAKDVRLSDQSFKQENT